MGYYRDIKEKPNYSKYCLYLDIISDFPITKKEMSNFRGRIRKCFTSNEILTCVTQETKVGKTRINGIKLLKLKIKKIINI